MKIRSLFITSAILFATTLASAAPPPDPDQKEITAFHLSMDNISKFGNASAALLKLTRDNPDLKKQMEAEDSKNKTVQSTVDVMEKKYPAAAAAIRAAGLSTRDFVVMTGTIMSTTMAVGMKKQGMLKEIPDTVSPENAAFVEQNYDKINSMLTKMMSESSR